MKKIEELEKKLSELQNELDELKKQPEKRYPKSKWVELWQYNNNALLISGLPFNNKYLLFAALVETCKEWNRIDEFVPEYDDQRTTIKNFSGTVFISTGILNGAIMLIDYTTAQLFLDTFRNELEQVKDLL